MCFVFEHNAYYANIPPKKIASLRLAFSFIVAKTENIDFKNSLKVGWK